MRREEPIAIVGMAGRYPSADDVGAFWDNLVAGRDCLTTFTDEELRAAGLDERTIAHPDFVRRGGVLAGHDRFDATYFGVPPREAMIKSPQQRVLLEVAHAALEDAGHVAGRYPGRVGVFVGANLNSYEWLHLLADRRLVREVGEATIQIANDLDYLATSIAWKLDLRGPGVDVQSACSTSLLAVHLAVRSLLAGECDMALAGGISVRLPLWPGTRAEMGYFYHQGGIWSSDGRTRTFDARADGTVFGSGAGVVALRPLADAVADGDAVYAVILGSAANNDGAAKVGYAAPGVDGQARAIADALARAGVDPRSIGLVEAHGTATAIGDPIEVAGLTQAYGARARDARWCLIGSVKSNIGHLSAAAGVAGLTKAALALHHGLVPRTLHFETPNPRIDFASSPFRVAAEPTPWPAGGPPRRAGVSAFGIGGTNVHVVLEEAPAPPPPAPARPWQVLPLSARTTAALEEATDRLAARLSALSPSAPAPSPSEGEGRGGGAPLADVAWTLQVGRAEHEHRRAVVCRDAADALETMASRDPRRMPTGPAAASWSGAAFLFPGQGAQHVGMGAGLRESEPVFRTELDRCCELAAAELGVDLRELLGAPPERAADAARALARTELTQPALFAVEYALARLWMSWGIRPGAMIGHSIGEYVAATLAGVFALEDAVRLVVERGRLVQALPPGAMLAVPLPEAEVVPLLGPGLDLAAVNGPRLCVVAGEEAAVAGLSARLESEGVVGRRLHTSHAFHSA
ncbi:MAG TPA: type I polyketide synthase, partial [Candidatus Dormibacteraeota bacterium]|nr:type I polyketide synthase [Candidatus Dormibacteraeota bacterium]